MDLVKRLIRDVPDFPKPGIVFKDITPVLREPAAFRQVIEALVDRYRSKGITQIVGIESRGFIFGAPLAYALGVGFAIIRKPGKLPADTYSVAYDLEYGQDTIEMHKDAVGPDDRVVLVDDLIATGGTARAAALLIEKAGAAVAEMAFVIELGTLKGRSKLDRWSVHALLTY